MVKKIIQWIVSFVPTILGIVEAGLKLLKEVLTLVVDILFPVIPIEKFKVIVTSIRATVDKVYDLVSVWKEKILKWIGLLNA